MEEGIPPVDYLQMAAERERMSNFLRFLFEETFIRTSTQTLERQLALFPGKLQYPEEGEVIHTYRNIVFQNWSHELYQLIQWIIQRVGDRSILTGLYVALQTRQKTTTYRRYLESKFLVDFITRNAQEGLALMSELLPSIYYELIMGKEACVNFEPNHGIPGCS